MQQAINVQPTVRYCKEIKVGASFVLDVDFQFNQTDWQFEEEEYAVHFIINGSAPFLSYRAIGDGCLLVHRFGGTYGPAKFLVKGEVPGQARLRILAINQYGVPLITFPITVEVIICGAIAMQEQ